MSGFYKLKATPETVTWGYFDNSTKPHVRVKPGDIVEIESLCHHAGDAPDYLMDEGVEAVYKAIPESERAPGVHLVTGPVYIEGVKPGDVLEAKILDMWPRIPYGVNFEANWGMLYNDFKQERATIFSADVESGLAKAEFSYLYNKFCDKPGRITAPGEVPRDKTFLKDIYIPLRMHFGIAGVGPKEPGRINTNPPASFGGNVDNRNFVKGCSTYYPVTMDGGLFYCGDSHFTQGDGEINGTAIEGHVTGLVQFFIRNDIKLGKNPVLETPVYYIVHGLGEDLELAMRDCTFEALGFLQENKGLRREEAYALLAIAGDFHVTQVVNGTKGIHCRIRKDLFVK